MKVFFDPILGKIRKSDAGAATWGAISGSLTNQNDLMDLLDDFISATGSANQYIKGDGSLDTFPTIINSIQITVPSAFTTSGTLTANGTIAITASGDSTQYIKGDGTLAAFPALTTGTVTSVGVSVPNAFSVTGAITTSGTIAITADGLSSQYIRGDGELANFPVSLAAGGASVNYFLNGNTSMTVVKDGVTCYELDASADTGASANFTKSTTGVIAAFLTPVNTPNALLVPAGNWTFQLYAAVASTSGSPGLSVKLYKYNGTTFTLIGAESAVKTLTKVEKDVYSIVLTIPSGVTLLATDRLAVEIIANNNAGNQITVYTENTNLAQITTTFSTGILSLNGLTDQVQTFSMGFNFGTQPSWASASGQHRLYLPIIGVVGVTRGLLSNTDYNTFSSKQAAITLVSNTTLTGNSTFSANTLSIPNYSLAVKDNGTGLVTQASAINFTGTGYTLSNVGREVTVNLTGGGSGGNVATASNNLFAYYNFI